MTPRGDPRIERRQRRTPGVRRGGAARGPCARAIAWGALGVAGALLGGCASPSETGDWAHVREITPAFLFEPEAKAPAPTVQDPAIAADAHGRVALTWVTRDAAGADLWLSVSRDSGTRFSDPVRVNLRARSVVSSPEGRPEPTFGPGGAFAVAWSESRGDTTGAVDLRVRASADGGYTLGPIATVNDDAAGAPPGLRWRAARRWRREHNPMAYHGHATLAFLPDGSLFAAWLDARRTAPPAGPPQASSLFYATSLDGGQTWSENASITDSACACCRPVAEADDRGRVALAYRRGSGRPSDPALAVSLDGGRSFARDTTISLDHWKAASCPELGPALTWNRAGGGHYAWFTGGAPAGVYVIPWRETGGAAGLRRDLSDSIAAAGHPRLAALGTTTLIGIEAQPHPDSARTVLAVRALEVDGTLTPWIFLGADARSGWLAGASRRSAFACWIERESGRDRVRLARLARVRR